MQDDRIVSNTKKNEEFYDSLYSRTDLKKIFGRLDRYQAFLADARITDASWAAMYWGDFDLDLMNKKVLELGCGDCLNAGIMSLLGAEVYANDISQVSGSIIRALNERYSFNHPIRFIEGNFLDAELESDQFDIVVGKAFVHHLTHEQEHLFHHKIIRLLKAEGRVRFIEPVENSKLLDQLRYMVPVYERPSSLQRKKFAAWKAMDTHPERENSCSHYNEIGHKYYEDVHIQVFGSIHRLHRFWPDSKLSRKFKRWAFRVERYLPSYFREHFARNQTIDYRRPKKLISA